MRSLFAASDPGLTIDELLAELEGAEAIIAHVDCGKRIEEEEVTLAQAAAKLRAVSRECGDQRGFSRPHWEGRVAHIGPILGGFAA